MKVSIQWQQVGGDDESLSLRRVLYAYARPRINEILYLGKADKCSVRERFHGPHKAGLYEYFVNDLSLNSFRAFVGELYIPSGTRFSSTLLSDIESLLISELQPCGNIQSIRSRFSLPGLHVTCYGDWPQHRRTFIDLLQFVPQASLLKQKK